MVRFPVKNAFLIKIAYLNSKCSKKNVVFVEKSQIKGYKGILIEIGWG